MRSPKVSVIIPVYKVEQYIERCARSLFEQTLDDIEYLFVDDCTPDHSIEILKEIIKEYPERQKQITIHRMEQNSGQAAVRKWGMLSATGEYVIHCDSDDWVGRDMYRAMYDKAKESNADMVVCDYCITDGEQKNDVYKGCQNTHREQLWNNILYGKDLWSLCNRLVLRDCCENITFPIYNMGEDMTMVCQLMYHCRKIEYIGMPFYNYYMNNGSITKDLSETNRVEYFKQVCENIKVVLSFWKEKPEYSIVRKGLNNLCFHPKLYLLPLIEKNTKYYKLCNSIFPRIGYHMFFDSNLSWSSRLRSLSIELRFYKLYHSLVKTVRKAR